MKLINNIQIFAYAALLATSCVAMDDKVGDEQLQQAAEKHRVEGADALRIVVCKKGPKSVNHARKLLGQGADPNTLGHLGTPLIFLAVRKDNDLSMVKLLLSQPTMNAYITNSYFRYGLDDYGSHWEEQTLLEFAANEDKNHLLKLLIYLGHESTKNLIPDAFNDPDIKKLVESPYAYAFSKKEKKKFKKTARAIGINNAAVLRPVFKALGLIATRNDPFNNLAPLIGEYLGLGLMPRGAVSKFRCRPCTMIRENCTIL